MGSPPLHEDVQRYLKLNHSPPRPRNPLSILNSHSSVHLAVKPAGSAFRTHQGSSVHSACLPSPHSWSGLPRLIDLPTSPSTATLVEFEDPGTTNPSSLQHQVKALVETTSSRLRAAHRPTLPLLPLFLSLMSCGHTSGSFQCCLPYMA